jgi:hypothetical protein
MGSFKTSLKKSLPASIVVFACVAVMVACSRLAFGLLETSGGLSYIYATSGSGTILEQMCEIFTGTSIVALVAIGGIIGGMIAALLGSAGWRFARGFAWDDAGVDSSDAGAEVGADAGNAGAGVGAGTLAAPRPALMPQFTVFALWMLVATVAIVAVFALVFLGTISDVQLASVTSKLGGGSGDAGASSGSGLMLPLTLLMLWTLLLMGGAVVFAAISAARGSRRKTFTLVAVLIAATVLIGILLVVLSVALFTRFNVVDIDYTALNTWLGISVAANLAVTALGLGISRFLIGRK